jgi:hypothetical protein
VETLEQAGWIVGGPRGAAAKLGLKRTTLLAEMRRLGISRPIKDNYGSLWLYAQCGLLRVEAPELAKWRERPDSQLAFQVFDPLDGAHPGYQAPFQPESSKAPDGRLWFTNGVIAQMIDPDRLYRNGIPPPVRIEEVIADHKTYSPQGGLRLPALTRDLEIDYTALSFVVPQKVQFRYKLDGYDREWQDPGTRRQAFYSNLVAPLTMNFDGF